ncbi:hypothetical protein RB195_002651 [Necator americanus]|uniref:Uncharacterized protein n=1 Tax=Necator americanus TaxID=51031 RepID=A0ABR1DLI4_NECAM
MTLRYETCSCVGYTFPVREESPLKSGADPKRAEALKAAALKKRSRRFHTEEKGFACEAIRNSWISRKNGSAELAETDFFPRSIKFAQHPFRLVEA